MHFQLIRELTIVQRTPCLSDGFRMIFFFKEKKYSGSFITICFNTIIHECSCQEPYKNPPYAFLFFPPDSA